MKREEILCKRLVEYKNQFGTAVGYKPCNKQIKFVAKFIGHKGDFETESVCGIHANQLKKISERMKRLHNLDTKLELNIVSEK